MRKIILGAALATGLLVSPAGAQDSPASVLPNTQAQSAQRPVEVQGAQLARTGSDLDAELMAGIGLTAAGMALAVTARQRRRRFATAS
ncbi:MAG: hypothetical protein ABWZ76_07310 [Acidimicrobiales bacterium]